MGSRKKQHKKTNLCRHPGCQLRESGEAADAFKSLLPNPKVILSVESLDVPGHTRLSPRRQPHRPTLSKRQLATRARGMCAYVRSSDLNFAGPVKPAWYMVVSPPFCCQPGSERQKQVSKQAATRKKQLHNERRLKGRTTTRMQRFGLLVHRRCVWKPEVMKRMVGVLG
jgi:hypothetical protein